MWGTNTKGTIPGTTEKVLDVPTFCDTKQLTDYNATIQQVVCGPNGTALVFSNGDCYTCGMNDQGQLGQANPNSTNFIETPTLLSLSNSAAATTTPLSVQSLDVGMKFSALIDANGELYTFGTDGSLQDGMGCLGHGDGQPYPTPKLVESLCEDGCLAKQVQVGSSHTTVLTTEGEVLTTGGGSYGRLGNLATEDQLCLDPVELLGLNSVVEIAGGHSFTMALTKDGILYSWGRNDKGQLGTGMGMSVDMYAMEPLPTPIESLLEGRKVVNMAVGHSHAACVTEEGGLFYWGSGNHHEPCQMVALLHTRIVDVVCGQDYTIALDDNGKMYSWGKGRTGVLGQASVKTLHQPELVEAMSDKKVVSMSAGYSHVACLVEEE